MLTKKQRQERARLGGLTHSPEHMAEIGKSGIKKQFKGKTKKEISDMMSKRALDRYKKCPCGLKWSHTGKHAPHVLEINI